MMFRDARKSHLEWRRAIAPLPATGSPTVSEYYLATCLETPCVRLATNWRVLDLLPKEKLGKAQTPSVAYRNRGKRRLHQNQDDLRLEKRHWIERPILVMDLSEASKQTGTRIDGFIGQDILREFSALRIDYKAGLVEFEQ